ncbi:hypothetical protein BO71DRAFT_333775 [Aspergillus ellipticus CBS 707.79]|uniref:Helicase C-terminal domain-containing protein n=1 Tax=Aspergillus ellipticus CBS 707.79 TaxID=1448320 RepID=A0A319DRL5_9EURO|nr:hypothetical protein BO71DRAFT_333775 [Aspergillus ellipticus CBS 707.79]
MCHNIHLFSPSTSRAIFEQAIGRLVRVGQTHTVRVYEYRIPGTFNIYLADRNMQKAIPGLIVMICTGLAPVLRNDGFSVEGWVIRDGNMVFLQPGETV